MRALCGMHFPFPENAFMHLAAGRMLCGLIV